jgi:hypothetical protein
MVLSTLKRSLSGIVGNNSSKDSTVDSLFLVGEMKKIYDSLDYVHSLMYYIRNDGTPHKVRIIGHDKSQMVYVIGDALGKNINTCLGYSYGQIPHDKSELDKLYAEFSKKATREAIINRYEEKFYSKSRAA